MRFQHITRRRLLLGAAACLLAPASAVAAQHSDGAADRIVAVDWAAAETLLMLGVSPIGIADLNGFHRSFPGGFPARPIADLGSSWEPNLELIDRMHPALIYISPWNALSQSALSSIAPVRISPIYANGGLPMDKAWAFARQVDQEFTRASQNTLPVLERRLESMRGLFLNAPGRAVLIVNLHVSGRFANVYSRTSLAGNVLAHLGLENTWREPTNGFGFARIGVDRLIEATDASIVIIGQGEQTSRALQALKDSAIWKAIPAVRAGRLHQSPPLSIFGGLASALSFAEWAAGSFARRV